MKLRPQFSRRVELSDVCRSLIKHPYSNLAELADKVTARSQPTTEQVEAEKLSRFLSKLDMDSITGCWVWTGGRDKPPLKPYGNFAVGGTDCVIKAHRYSYALFNGAVPENVLVLHQCDNPTCCNPAHLFLGSHKDNTADMYAKGREYCTRGIARPDMVGIKSRNAKLDDDKVRQIRSMYVPNVFGFGRIAQLFGIKKCAVMNVVHRKTWRHI